MPSHRLPLVLATSLLLAAPPHASGQAMPGGEAGSCRYVELAMTPSDDLQIVIWIEDAAGNYVDTAYITRLTGSYGLGNRPGIMEFNSGPLWPYGRRVTTFPVWAHRHGLSFPLVVFQDEDDDDLSHPITQSSNEAFYCRPIRPDEDLWDANSCATVVYTDKGVLSGDQTSLYPPRSDLSFDPGRDDESVQMMAAMNPFDAVSRATPVGGALFTARWSAPNDLPDGDYVAWIEVSKEFDQNESYDYPSPEAISWSDYGVAYRGQPSVLYQVPFTIDSGEDFTATAAEYVGYGDPDGLDGELRAPDTTITTDVPGSGASRLLLTPEGSDMFRVKVRARSEQDEVAPGGVGQLAVDEVSSRSMQLSFIAPGDDDQEGLASAYEIRYRAGEPITADNFQDSTLAGVTLVPEAAGEVQELTIAGLLPSTNYHVGIRATDNCGNVGELVSVHALTPEPEPAPVDACFVATAAYGSLMANEVVALRDFRDRVLRASVPGELVVASYYTFGPALARLIEPSPTLRSAARSALAPLVEAATGD